MDGMKSLLSAFDVKADRIDRRVGAGQDIGNHPLVSNVGLDRLKTRIIGTEPDAVRRSERKTRARGDVETQPRLLRTSSRAPGRLEQYRETEECRLRPSTAPWTRTIVLTRGTICETQSVSWASSEKRGFALRADTQACFGSA